MTGSPNADGPDLTPLEPPRTLPGQRVVNLLVRGLLRTPGVCRVVGSRLVILYVVGRSSGRRYSVPVTYLLEGDDLLLGTSFGWGRNLRTGTPVDIRFKGERRTANVRTFTTESEVVSAYAHMARLNPVFASFSNIGLGADGEPDLHDLHRVWAGGARAIRLMPR